MKRLIPFALTALIAGLVACGPPPGEGEGENEPEFSDEPLGGLVDGQSWTLQAAATDDFISDEDGFFTRFFGTPVEGDPCDTLSGSDILHSIPTEVGTFRFNLQRNLTFVVEEDGEIVNKVATSGAVRVDDIDDEAALITGAINARFDGDNDIDGTFEATICPPR